MPLWGTEDTAAAKPQIGGRSQNAIKARDIFATVAGWSQAGAGRATTGKQHELLVAMRGLSTVLIGGTGQTAGTGAQVKASVTSMNWNITTFDKSAGGTLSISANFNEAITVTGNPTLEVTNGNQGSGSGRGPHSLVYNASLSTANRMTFILAIAAAHASTNAGDILVVGANKVALAGGGVVGADGQAALITHADALPGAITVVA